MKALFLLATLLGFGGTLAGAHYAPWLHHVRLPSQTTVVANGGRAERFVINLPADRIAVTDGNVGGLRAAVAGGLMILPARLANAPMLVEHFKVRDSAGSVIGVAARHWAVDGAARTTWSVLVPSRGALLLAAPGEPERAVETALARSGYASGKPWSGQVAISMVADGDAQLLSGSGEFAGLGGRYTETWTLAGVDDAGRLLGTIELYTITTRAP